jgi:hypothetical protein
MDLHKPKPIHNWRDFVKEVGIIVLGVSIALAAEQGVEWVHWHNRVAEARRVIGNELAGVMAQGIERVRGEHCIEQRLDDLAAILDEATRKGALPPVPQIGQPADRNWPDDIWQTTMASDTATHFPQDQLNQLGRVYAEVRTLRESNQNEQVAWANLSTIIGPGRRLDPASDAALRAALSQARYYSRIMALAGGQAARNIGALGLPYEGQSRNFLDRVLHRNLSTSLMCQKLAGAAPAQYGQAQLRNTLNTFRDWQKYPPYVAAPPQREK